MLLMLIYFFSLNRIKILSIKVDGNKLFQKQKKKTAKIKLINFFKKMAWSIFQTKRGGGITKYS